jgi:hypothetical protein
LKVEGVMSDEGELTDSAAAVLSKSWKTTGPPDISAEGSSDVCNRT